MTDFKQKGKSLSGEDETTKKQETGNPSNAIQLVLGIWVSITYAFALQLILQSFDKIHESEALLQYYNLTASPWQSSSTAVGDSFNRLFSTTTSTSLSVELSLVFAMLFLIFFIWTIEIIFASHRGRISTLQRWFLGVIIVQFFLVSFFPFLIEWAASIVNWFPPTPPPSTVPTEIWANLIGTFSSIASLSMFSEYYLGGLLQQLASGGLLLASLFLTQCTTLRRTARILGFTFSLLLAFTAFIWSWTPVQVTPGMEQSLNTYAVTFIVNLSTFIISLSAIAFTLILGQWIVDNRTGIETSLKWKAYLKYTTRGSLTFLTIFSLTAILNAVTSDVLAAKAELLEWLIFTILILSFSLRTRMGV